MTAHDLRSLIWASGATVAGVLVCMRLVAAAPAPTVPADEGPFLTENDVAMEKMMTGMNVKPSGDVDQDFAAMMIPHHQGAIDMALAELRYGRNEQLRRIAQEIIVSQQQEIAAMHLAVGQAVPAPAAAPTQVPFGVPTSQVDHDHHAVH
jgi:hypothetical protein